MANETSAVLKTFHAYIEAFNKKDPKALLPFYDYPALIVDKERKPKTLSNPIIGFIGFSVAIRELRKKGFEYSELHQLSTKQLRENLAIVSGTATRWKQDESKLEDIGFTYTLRKTPKGWKIIAGIVHDIENYLTLSDS